RDRTPEKLAFTYLDKQVSYAEMDDLVNQTAHAFLEKGMRKDEMVTVMSKNSLDFVVANFALARVGAVMIPINYMLSGEDVQYIVGHAEVTGFVASEEYAPVLDQAAVSIDINHRYVMDTKANDPLSADLSAWEHLSAIRDGQPIDFV